jgi:hypothetical protein
VCSVPFSLSGGSGLIKEAEIAKGEKEKGGDEREAKQTGEKVDKEAYL